MAPPIAFVGMNPRLLCSRNYPPDTFAKADADRAFAFAPGLQADLVAIFEEAAGFSVRQLDRLFAASADFEKRSEPFVAVRRQGARADQVAGLEVAAVRGVVRDDLRRAP